MKTPPYAAGTWVPCPGSALMSERYSAEADADRDDTRRLEGRAAHWVAERWLASYKQGVELTLADFRGKVSPDGPVIVEEMLIAARIYIESILTVCGMFLAGLTIEKQVSLRQIAGDGRLAGRIDAVWISQDKKHIVIWDFKYGLGPITVLENWQLLLYAATYALENRPALETITLVLVKPCGAGSSEPEQTWTLTPEQVRWYASWIGNSFHLAQQGENAPTHPGSHCSHCPGRRACSALTDTAYAAIAYTSTAMPTELEADALGAELKIMERFAAAVKHRHEALKEDAIRKMKAGQHVPGFSLTRKRGDRKWHNLELAKQLASTLGISMVEEKPLSPKKAEEAGLPSNIVNRLTSRAEGAPSLTSVAESERKAGEVFNAKRN